MTVDTDYDLKSIKVEKVCPVNEICVSFDYRVKIKHHCFDKVKKHIPGRH